MYQTTLKMLRAKGAHKPSEVLTNGVSTDTLESIFEDCQTQIQILYAYIAREHLGLV